MRSIFMEMGKHRDGDIPIVLILCANNNRFGILDLAESKWVLNQK